MTQASENTTALRHAATQPLLQVTDLAVSFVSGSGPDAIRRKAVDGVSLSVYPQQTLAVVGESGCGKSVTALSVMRLIQPPGRIDHGSILFQERNLRAMSEHQMLQVRGRDIAMIFQEPMTSLNPVYCVGDQIIEAILLHQNVNRKQAVAIAVQAMNDVGIANPHQRLKSYPHQFSGGMRQRVMIAMALACQPRLLLADEPTTALDVTIQAQILELLQRLQRERGMGIMLITHDLGIVAQNADVVCVMYAGKVVEYATVFDLFEQPLHPYTRGLLNSRPNMRSVANRLSTVAEFVNDPEQFRSLTNAPNGPVPWWPKSEEHQAPGTLGAGLSEYTLYEVLPQHWVACQHTAVANALPAARKPNLSFRRSDALQEASRHRGIEASREGTLDA